MLCELGGLDDLGDPGEVKISKSPMVSELEMNPENPSASKYRERPTTSQAPRATIILLHVRPRGPHGSRLGGKEHIWKSHGNGKLVTIP